MSDTLQHLLTTADEWETTAISAAIALIAVLVIARLMQAAAARALRADTAAGQIVRRINAPLTAVTAFVALMLVLHAAPDDVPRLAAFEHLVGVLLILAITWLLLRSVSIGTEAVIRLNPFAGEDNLRARARLTRARVLSRTLYFLIVLVGLSIALMTFPAVRQIGTSLLASAGIVGLAVGLAAKPVLSNLLAGLQIAFTQPIRIDDVVVLEGEWGRVEEITATYVVVAIWDQRRLVVPLQYFIEKPFQNWTRTNSQILGTVFLWMDYRLPVETIREETKRLCEHDKDWDGRVAIVQVTDTSESCMQLRILVSSIDSGRNFDLRCRVREGLIHFVGRQYPAYLPHVKAEVITGIGVRAVPQGEPPGDQAVSPTPTVPQA